MKPTAARFCADLTFFLSILAGFAVCVLVLAHGVNLWLVALVPLIGLLVLRTMPPEYRAYTDDLLNEGD